MNRLVASLAVATFGAILPPAFAGDTSAPPVSDSTPADGGVELSGGAVAVGIGYTWGNGSLTFKNRKPQLQHQRAVDHRRRREQLLRQRQRLSPQQTIRLRRQLCGPFGRRYGRPAEEMPSICRIKTAS